MKPLLGILLIAICWLPVNAQTTLLEEAQERASAGDYEGAIVLYDDYLLANPEDARVYGFRALAYSAIPDLDAALADMETGLGYVEDEPELAARLLVLRAEFHIHADDLTAALADYDKAIEHQPEYVLAYLNRGLVYESLGDYDKTLADYAAVIDLQPDEVTIYLRRAQLYTALEDPAAALADYSTAIDLEPDNAQLYIMRGHIHLTQEDWPAAATDYAEWLTRIESDHQLHAELTGNTTRRLSMMFGQVHELPFQAVGGQRVSIAAASRSVDSMLVVLGPDGNALIADDDGGEGLNAFIRDFALPETGTYTLIVGHARGGWDGRLTLNFALTEIL